MTSTNTDKTENASNGWVAIQDQLKGLEEKIKTLCSKPEILDFHLHDEKIFRIDRRNAILFYDQCNVCLNALITVNEISSRDRPYINEIRMVLDDIQVSVDGAIYDMVVYESEGNNGVDRSVIIGIAYVLHMLQRLTPREYWSDSENSSSASVLADFYSSYIRKDVKESFGVIARIKNIDRAAAGIFGNIKKKHLEFEVLHAKATKDSLSLEDALKKLTDVDEYFKNANAKINELLSNAGKIGLAKSFQDRRIILEQAQEQWRKLFVGGIALIFLAVFLEQFIIQKETALTINAVLTRMLLAAPMVWLTWFAARQFGNNARLIEDYAFKESSALAYHGYKNEFLADQDHETMTVLRKVAAENFGANPTRMLAGQEAASPLHELLEGALKKEGFDKIVTVLHALNPKAKDDSAAKKDDKKDDKKEE